MSEILYRPYAADGTHFCENRDREGWLKGSTLDDDSNKVHGTLDLEPVEVDLDGDNLDGLFALACAAVGILLYAAYENRDKIVSWISNSVVQPLKNRWYKHRDDYSEKSDNADDSAFDNVVDIQLYLDTDETQKTQQTSVMAN